MLIKDAIQFVALNEQGRLGPLGSFLIPPVKQPDHTNFHGISPDYIIVFKNLMLLTRWRPFTPAWIVSG